MTALPLEEIPRRVLKRAQYEAFEFELVGEQIRVRNASYVDPENHEYELTIAEGIPIQCTCPADARFDSPCKHRVAVAIRRPILDLVTEVQSKNTGETPRLRVGNSAEERH
ncbi:SWIM zinc finger family protein [Halapricum desulfuricans]|uniref:SWIM family zinc finger n=1 Tax=Halapricum desulfuricans TaxID=2841257 RepID=A0A897N203_9EURY|nr:SWIM zinc finger family protein [Halapricum desulfuricans]QSG05119.1 SWIM family zinc finger [Halapricum desulfuricans]